ncbi:FUSC family protein [Desulforegula conservatrix]|uniref:FUSC family protein n=1 Tax=Desulforegula conservatrix TaxID=153026 RepID=UPI0003F642CB|nr:FUSC family protein [Desulforegula conservatrix]
MIESKNIIVNIKNRLAFTNLEFQYILKCLIGVSVCYIPYVLVPQHEFYWSIISVLLVLAPDHSDSNRLAMDRMKANVIGSVVGLLAFLFLEHVPVLVVLCIAVIVNILICYMLGLESATRSALAALVIVLIQEKERSSWASGFERMGCVIVGCLIAIIITYIFSRFEKMRNGRNSVSESIEK